MQVQREMKLVPCMSKVWWAAWWQPHLKCVDISRVCNSQVYVLLLCSLSLLSCHVSMHGSSRISILLMRQEWMWIHHFPCRWQLVWILLLVLKLTFQEPVTELEPKTLHTLIMLESQWCPLFVGSRRTKKTLNCRPLGPLPFILVGHIEGDMLYKCEITMVVALMKANNHRQDSCLLDELTTAMEWPRWESQYCTFFVAKG